LLASALSRLGSNSLAASLTPDTATQATVSAAPAAAVRASGGTPPITCLSRLGRLAGPAVAGASFTSREASLDIIGSSKGASVASASRSSSSSSSSSGRVKSGQLGSSAYWFSKRAPPTEITGSLKAQGAVSSKPPGVDMAAAGLVPPAGGAAGSVVQQVGSTIDSFTGRGWWPAWASWGAAHRQPHVAAAAATSAADLAPSLAGAASSSAAPVTPPPTPMSASFTGGVNRIHGNTSAAGASASSVPASTAVQRLVGAAGLPSSTLQPVGATASEGANHLAAAATHASQAMPLLAAAFVSFVGGALLQLGSSGVATAAWLAHLVLWWALLPVQFAQWGARLPVRAVVFGWEVVMWVAERVEMPHDDRVTGEPHSRL
jgi:hypothetical protein